jgi:hypothetical protein
VIFDLREGERERHASVVFSSFSRARQGVAFMGFARIDTAEGYAICGMKRSAAQDGSEDTMDSYGRIHPFDTPQSISMVFDRM